MYNKLHLPPKYRGSFSIIYKNNSWLISTSPLLSSLQLIFSFNRSLLAKINIIYIFFIIQVLALLVKSYSKIVKASFKLNLFHLNIHEESSDMNSQLKLYLIMKKGLKLMKKNFYQTWAKSSQDI
ncbi:hypothetical protein BpHYR1_003514 [Brachionus plicatilis]|uniref:Transmembrane protein n=1 Tax=Brachionus plicatilis TaxID=10195 RepID=A0A3M7S058_BRAPC|nr:hypothetical protein BpHYR1_003514 [Brachionus plicatilis]